MEYDFFLLMSEQKNRRRIRSRSILPKGLQDFLILQIFYVARGFIRLAAFLTESQARWLVRVVYRPFSRFNRRICQRNLAAFFQPLNRDPGEVDRIYRGYLEYMIRFQEETARCFFMPFPDLEQKVLLEGETRLRETLEMGGGALIVSAHMGTWWHLPCLLAARGFKVNVVFNSFPYAPIENYLQRRASRYGIRLAFVDKGIPKMMHRAAQNNEIVYLTFDVAVRRRHGSWFPFGATRININAGPAILVLRYRMPVHYGTTYHCDDGRSRIVIHPEIISRFEGKEVLPGDLCRAWVDRLHSEILVHPEQWWGWGFSDLPLIRRQPLRVSDTCDRAPTTVGVNAPTPGRGPACVS